MFRETSTGWQIFVKTSMLVVCKNSASSGLQTFATSSFSLKSEKSVSSVDNNHQCYLWLQFWTKFVKFLSPLRSESGKAERSPQAIEPQLCCIWTLNHDSVAFELWTAPQEPLNFEQLLRSLWTLNRSFAASWTALRPYFLTKINHFVQFCSFF